MKILFTAAGSTDPVSKYRDGGILHILRHYKPERIECYLTKAMGELEREYGRYSKSIKSVASDCAYNFIYADVESPQKLDELSSLAGAFDILYRENPGAEFLINLSSGTPQMKMIMAFIAMNYEGAKGIQVFDPEPNGPKNHRGDKKDEDVELLLETNEDAIDAVSPNRCSEPVMHRLSFYKASYEMKALIARFDYIGAKRLYEEYEELFTKRTGDLIEHAALRMELKYNEARSFLREEANELVRSDVKHEVRELNEFLMLADIRQRTNNTADFILKMTPFTYRCGLYYIENRMGIPLESIFRKKPIRSKKKNGGHSKEAAFSWVLDEGLMRDYPDVRKALEEGYLTGIRWKTDVGTPHLICILKGLKAPDDIIDVIRTLRAVEEKIRHRLAHDTKLFDDEDIQDETDMTTADILKLMYRLFETVMDKERYQRDFAYAKINEKIEEQINASLHL